MDLTKDTFKIYSAHAEDGSVGVFSSNDKVIDPNEDSKLGVSKDGYYLIPEGEVDGEVTQSDLGNGVKAKLLYESYYVDEAGNRYTTIKASTTGIPSEEDYDVLGNLEVECPVEISSNGVSPSADGHITWDRNLYSINVHIIYTKYGSYSNDFIVCFYEGETWEYIVKFPKAHTQVMGIYACINSDGVVCYRNSGKEY